MKTYDEKKDALIDMACLYLESTNNKLNDIDSINFLILKALVLSNDVTNFYVLDIEINDEIRKSFVDMEYDKVSVLNIELTKKGKIILDDAKIYYNNKFNNINIEELNKIAQLLDKESFHI